MYYCEVDSLRYGNVIVKVFDQDHRLVGVGTCFGENDCYMRLHKKIDSPEALEKIRRAMAEDKNCPQVNWQFSQPALPSADKPALPSTDGSEPSSD